eukprot:TRINITY_DN11924_c0_g1_i2.p1 TRINITY_DN11924_c0_g1~~TRINITY_DN11924_c0_g1_i2.p1  ORF type:complete len:140 (+),score=17.64 TRINITY_DN11924_c0_g1_i2:189-608(+)
MSHCCGSWGSHTWQHLASCLRLSYRQVDASNGRSHAKFNGLLYHEARLNDVDSADLLSVLRDVVGFIDQARESEDAKVLVHCFRGLSRSVALCVGYMVSERGEYAGDTVQEALAMVQEHRAEAQPNAGFMEQLEQWNQP